MTRSPVQLDQHVKDKLDQFKDNHRYYLKTYSDAVEKLIESHEMRLKEQQEYKAERMAESARIGQEYIYVGQEVKERFTAVQRRLGLSGKDTLEFLLDLFEDPTVPVSRLAFENYLDRRK